MGIFWQTIRRNIAIYPALGSQRKYAYAPVNFRTFIQGK